MSDYRASLGLLASPLNAAGGLVMNFFLPLVLD